MPDLAQRPQQPYLHRPPASDSDEGPIVVPAPPQAPGPAVVVQPPGGVQVAPVIVPPPGAARPESPSRGSTLSSSGFSGSSPRPTLHAAPSDIHRVSYHPGSRRSSPSGSSISSRTLPPGHSTIVNVAAPQPPTMMPTFPGMPQTVGPPGPPINIVAPSTPTVHEHALVHAQMPPIIIQPPVWPPQQQLQQVPPIVTTVQEPRRRRHRRYATSSPSSSSSPSYRSTRSRSRSRERRRRPSYTPSRTSRAHSYSPTRRRRPRSPSYSPSRRPSQYYSSSRPTRSQTPTPIPGQGFTVVPPSQYPPQISTTSPSQVHPQAGQIYIHPPPPPGMPGVVHPGIIQPPIIQPGGFVGHPVTHLPAPTPYFPSQPLYPPPGSAYIPATSIHRTRRSSSPSTSTSPSPSRRLRRSSRSSSSRPARTSEPGVFVVPTAGVPTVPTATVLGDGDRRRHRSPSSSPSRLRRVRRTRRPSRSLSYSSDPSEYGRDGLRRARHRRRVARSRTPTPEEPGPSRRRRVLRRDPRTEEIEDIYGSHSPTAVTPSHRPSPSRLPYPPSRRDYSPTHTHRTRSPRTRSPRRPYIPRSPTHTHRTYRSRSYSPRTRRSSRSPHVLHRRPSPGGTTRSRSRTPTQRISRSPLGRIIPRSSARTRRYDSQSPVRRRRHRSPTLTARRDDSQSPVGRRRYRSPTLTARRVLSRSPTRRITGRPSRRGSPSSSLSYSPSGYGRGRYARESRSTRTPTSRYERSRSITPTGRRSVSLTPSGTRSSRSPSRRSRRDRRPGRRSRSYSTTPTSSLSPSRPPPHRRLPSTQPTTTVMIGPAPSVGAPTYVGYDPEDGRRSGVAPVSRSAEGEEPEPIIRTGTHIR